MLPKVLSAYDKVGYSVDLGSPARLYSVIRNKKTNREVMCSGGFTVSDAFLFISISKVTTPAEILVIGNSFGLSTFVLADLFPDANIDAIDAEIEDLETHLGSDITRKIIANDYPNVRLTIGFSPDDLPKVANGKKYDFIFVDAYHTNEAVLKDWYGIQNMIAADCVIYFHDVVSCNMLDAWTEIKKDGLLKGFDAFEFGFTQMGCTALVYGNKEVRDYFVNAQNNFVGPYLIGYTGENKREQLGNRPFFWDMTFSRLEALVRRKLRRIFIK